MSAFEHLISFESWENYPSRVEFSTDKVLEILELFNVKATFFILGWVAQKCPGLVKKIHSSGHEIASHGYKHSLIYNLTPEIFRKDLVETRALLEDLIGEGIKGFRGASFSVTKKSLWALEVLAEEGFLYDSSIFPVYHDRYGIPTAPVDPFGIHLRDGKKIIEFPPLSVKLLGRNFPIGGGGYLRLFPVNAVMRVIKKKNARGIPAMIYFHPWEIDPRQPFIDSGSRITNMRHRVGLRKMEQKLKVVMSTLKFSTFRSMLDDIHIEKISLSYININEI